MTFYLFYAFVYIKILDITEIDSIWYTIFRKNDKTYTKCIRKKTLFYNEKMILCLQSVKLPYPALKFDPF